MAIHLILHTPKTGGTRLGELLQSQTGIHFLQVKGEPFQDQTPLLVQFANQHRDSNRPVVLMGHFLANIHEQLNCEPRYYTLFREPVERDISGYEYILDNPEHPDNEAAKRTGLIEFITANWLPNVQLRHLLGNCDFFEGHTSAEMIELARWRLRNWFTLVGTHQDYRGFVAELFNRLNLPPVEVESVATKGQAGKRALASEDLAKLYARNELDSLLWAGLL